MITNEENKAQPQNTAKTERVEVNKEALEKVLSRLDKLEQENKKLLSIADIGRLAHYESIHKDDSPKTYRLSTYKGKIIIAWKMADNRVWKDEMGKWREKQNIMLVFENEENTIIPYIEFTTNTEKIKSKLVSATQKGGKTYLELETDEGKKIIIDSIFVN